MIRFLLLIFVGLLFGISVGWFFADDSGYVLIQHGTWAFESTFVLFTALFVLFFAAVWFLLWLLRRFFRMPTQISMWFRNRRSRKLWLRVERALNFLLEGNFAKAEKQLVRIIDGGHPTDAISLVGSVIANHALADPANVALRLDKLAQSEIIKPTAAELFHIYVLVEQNRAEEALTRLKPLLVRRGVNRHALTLHYRACTALQDWKAMAPYLEIYRKKGVKSKATLFELEKKCACVLIEEASQVNAEQIRRVFKQFSAEIRSNPAVYEFYAYQLSLSGQATDAEKEIALLLDKTWNHSLLHNYSTLRMASYDRMFQRCEGWLRNYPNDAYLLYVAGMLAFRCQIWGRARSYLEQSIKLDPQPETYILMGQLLEELDEPHHAVNCFRQASMMVFARAQPVWQNMNKEEQSSV